MIVLDTQVVSQLQRGGDRDRERLDRQFQKLQDNDVRITIVSPYEQFKSCLGQIKLNYRKPAEDVEEFDLLLRLTGYYSLWKGRILPFDDAAVRVFQGMDAKLVRDIKSCDARIAAIATVHSATVITVNLRDFRQVPGLRVEGW
jgi:tRNA(fMet)-specific endonuclease VapC